MYGQKILIFGGTGSLGYALTSRFTPNNEIVIFSRDENKQWHMKHKFKDVEYIIGNVQDPIAVRTSILSTEPTIIIIASALKHIDLCEVNIDESIRTNICGTQNIIQSIIDFKPSLLRTILFVSTDKACDPINNYGMCKAISETMMVEKALKYPQYRFITTRYGNVLTSRGSIIPLLHKIGQDPDAKYFTLTHKDMTRFVMTLDESVDLIEHALLKAENGDIVVPVLKSMNIQDLLEIFQDIYHKPIQLIGIRPGEKLTESLYNEYQSLRIERLSGYIHIKSQLKNMARQNLSFFSRYDSNMNVLTKEELKEYLKNLGLLD